MLDNVFVGDAQNIIAGATVTDNSLFYDFELVDDTNNVDVTIVQAVVHSEIAETTNNATIGEVLLNELSGSTDTEINQIQANLGAATHAKELNDILEASGPTVDNGVITGAMAITNGALNIATGRLASLRKGTQSGVSNGNLSEGTQIWMQAFGAEGTQDRRALGGANLHHNRVHASAGHTGCRCSLSYAQTNNWQLTANYNFEYKSDYEAHSGSVWAACKF